MIYRVLCRDETARLYNNIFNSEYTVKQLHPGKVTSSTAKAEGSMTNRQMSSPIFIKADAPVKKRSVYPLTAGLSQKMVSKYIATALENAGRIEDFVPTDFLPKVQSDGFEYGSSSNTFSHKFKRA